ncbi:MAG: Crp/Fnr family transcriptional regulator [Spirochaetales bacterium]
MVATIDDFFPNWKKLEIKHQNMLRDSASFMSVPKNTLLHNGDADCIGVMLVYTGQLRVYMMSEEGKEVSLYRIFERDMCLLSASCMLASIQFESFVEADKNTTFWLIPAYVYRKIMDESLILANYTNDLMASRFTDVMWLMEQIVFKSMDERLADFLISESSLEESNTIKITHEKIAQYLGSAREVVTRLLKYFQDDGAVSLSRGGITIINEKKLQKHIDRFS